MAIIARMAAAQRALSLEDPRVPITGAQLVELMDGTPTASGVQVNEFTAMNLSAVWAAVRLLANAVAVPPLILYERLERGRRRASSERLYQLLHDRPNPEMTAVQFKQTVQAHAVTWGNGYAEIERDGAGRPVALWPLLPHLTRVERRNGRKIVVTTLLDGQQVALPAEDVLHIPGPGYDGLMGYSVIRMARESLGLARAAELYGASWFAGGGRPSGVLMYDKALSPEQKANLRQEWQQVHGGLKNAHRVAILEAGMKWQQIGLPPGDAQFLGTREFSVEEIARWFGVPPHKLAHLKNAHFNNIEHQKIEFHTDSALPWYTTWEQAVSMTLIPERDRGRLYAEFLAEALLRGDHKTRYEAYSIGRQWGWLSANDIRELENMNPLPGREGDIYLVPLNMIPASVAAQAGTGEGDDGDRQARALPAPSAGPIRERRAVVLRTRYRSQYERLFRDAGSRIFRRIIRAARRQAERIGEPGGLDAFTEWLAGDFWGREADVAADQVRGIVESYAEAVQTSIAEEIGVSDEVPTEVERFASDYASSIGAREAESSRGQLREVVQRAELNDADPRDAVLARLDEWEATRADKFGAREARRAGNALAEALYIAAGVRALRWTTSGASTCPYCESLAGMVVPAGSAFLVAGQRLGPDDNPLEIKTTKRHPPAHDGCDCIITAA